MYEAHEDGVIIMVRKSVTSANVKRKTKTASSSDRSTEPEIVRLPSNKPYGVKSNAKYDWLKIRDIFVEGEIEGDDRNFLGLKEIADKYGVPYQRIRERSSKERWPDRRAAYQLELTKERQRKHAQMLAKNAVGFDEKSYKVADLGMTMVTARLAEIAQEVSQRQTKRQDALRRQAEGLPVEKWELYSAVNYREMEGLAQAAAQFQTIGMRALGTDVNRHEISGPDGGPIETHTISIVAELGRDDPDRMSHLLRGLIEANLISPDMVANSGEVVQGEIVSGEVIDDDDSPEALGSM